MSYFFAEMAAKVLTMLLITLIGVAGAWLTAKSGKHKELQNISAATDEATKTAQRVVLELQQTVVEGLKAASADGKLADSEIEHLGALLLEKALAQMSQPAKKILEAAGADLCGIIKSAGEGMILALKKG